MSNPIASINNFFVLLRSLQKIDENVIARNSRLQRCTALSDTQLTPWREASRTHTHIRGRLSWPLTILVCLGCEQAKLKQPEAAEDFSEPLSAREKTAYLSSRSSAGRVPRGEPRFSLWLFTEDLPAGWETTTGRFPRCAANHAISYRLIMTLICVHDG